MAFLNKKVDGNEHAHKILYAGTTDPELKTYIWRTTE